MALRARRNMDWDDYFRQQADRQLAEKTEDALITNKSLI
jgi:hypothetical protein